MSTSNTSGHLYEPHKSYLGGPRRRDTEGAVTFSDKIRYVGETKGGKLDGFAKIFLPNGDIYEGEVLAGEASGKGTMKFGAGGRYTGEFKKGLFDGRGTMYDAADKPAKQAYWSNGKLTTP